MAVIKHDSAATAAGSLERTVAAKRCSDSAAARLGGSFRPEHTGIVTTLSHKAEAGPSAHQVLIQHVASLPAAVRYRLITATTLTANRALEEAKGKVARATQTTMAAAAAAGGEVRLFPSSMQKDWCCNVAEQQRGPV